MWAYNVDISGVIALDNAFAARSNLSGLRAPATIQKAHLIELGLLMVGPGMMRKP